MKSIFTNTEIAILAKTIAPNTNLSMRINKGGNIDIAHKNTNEVHFVFYKRPDGYFIRRRLGVFKGFNQHGGIMNGGKHFTTIKGVAEYFSNYMESRPNSLVQSYRVK